MNNEMSGGQFGEVLQAGARVRVTLQDGRSLEGAVSWVSATQVALLEDPEQDGCELVVRRAALAAAVAL